MSKTSASRPCSICVGGAACVAVEAVNSQTCRSVGGVATFAASSLTGDAMFGAEERDEFHAVGMGEDVNGAAALRIHAGLIGDQSDAFAAQRREILLLRGRRCQSCVCSLACAGDDDACGGVGAGSRDAARNCYRAFANDATKDKQNLHKTDTKHGGGGFVVRHATVCYIQPRDASVNMEGSELVRCVNSGFPRCSCSFS